MTILKHRVLVAILGFATLATAAIAFAPQQPPPGDARPSQAPPAPGEPGRRPPFDRPGGPGGPGGRQVSVSGAMKTMNRAMHQRQGQISDASKRAENLALINDIERGAVSAKGAPLPDDVMKNGKDDAAKSKMVEDFRRALMKSVRTALDIEDNILAGKSDAAKAGMEELIKQRDAGHTALGVQLDEDEK